MDRREKIQKIISLLLEEEPEYRQQAARFPQDMESQRRLLRSLMNVHYPGKRLNPEYLRLQDELLAEEREEKGVVDVMELPVDFNEKLFHQLADYATVYPDGRVVFTFRNGAEVSTKI